MFRRVLADERGVTIVEFAMISPVMFMLLLGGFDMGHTMYMRAQVQGIVQKASRDSSLETSATSTAQATIDQKVRNGVLALANNAKIDFKRRYFRTFADAAAKKEEPYKDTNNNKTCDNNELFTDVNNNGVWDVDGADDEGGAKDRAVYTVTVSYPRMFPALYFTASPQTTVQAVTILENQPWEDQGTYGPAGSGHCK